MHEPQIHAPQQAAEGPALSEVEGTGRGNLVIETRATSAQGVTVTEDALIVDLSDGRTLSVPLAWYPRLLHGTPAERNNWRLIGDGEGIHWPDLDEDISVESLVLGKASGESQRSLKQWLEQRAAQGE